MSLKQAQKFSQCRWKNSSGHEHPNERYGRGEKRNKCKKSIFYKWTDIIKSIMQFLNNNQTDWNVFNIFKTLETLRKQVYMP